jgi:diguanylate cyclase (GGDEF)-like protein
MVFLSAPAFEFSAVLVGLAVLALLVLMRPGLPGDQAALRWWIAGDLALVAQRLPPLLQPAMLWPGHAGDGVLPVADLPTVIGFFLILGFGCHTKALAVLCGARLTRTASWALLTVPPVAVAVTAHLLPPASQPLPIFLAVAGLMLAEIRIIRHERAGSRALRIMTGVDAVACLIATVCVVAALAGFAPPVPPTGPDAPPFMPPWPGMISDLVGSIVMTFSMCMALQEHQQTLVTRLSTTDQLTGAVNRRGMLPLLDQALRRGAREPFSVAVLDIDHFKRVNDQYGHEAGDAVLIGFADAVTALCRAGDVLGRWGGEEFLLLMPNTGPASARAAVQRIQSLLPDHLAGRVPCIVTFSAGIATVRDHAPGGIDSLIARADKVLYAAKVTRNCVVSDGLEAAEATPLAAAQ